MARNNYTFTGTLRGISKSGIDRQILDELATVGPASLSDIRKAKPLRSKEYQNLHRVVVQLKKQGVIQEQERESENKKKKILEFTEGGFFHYLAAVFYDIHGKKQIDSEKSLEKIDTILSVWSKFCPNLLSNWDLLVSEPKFRENVKESDLSIFDFSNWGTWRSQCYLSLMMAAQDFGLRNITIKQAEIINGGGSIIAGTPDSNDTSLLIQKSTEKYIEAKFIHYLLFEPEYQNYPPEFEKAHNNTVRIVRYNCWLKEFVIRYLKNENEYSQKVNKSILNELYPSED